MSALNTLRKWNVSSVERWRYKPLKVHSPHSPMFKIKDSDGKEIEYYMDIQLPRLTEQADINQEANLDSYAPGTQITAFVVFRGKKDLQGVCSLGILPHVDNTAENEENLDERLGHNGNPVHHVLNYSMLGGNGVRFSSGSFPQEHGRQADSYALISNGLSVDHLRNLGETAEWFLNLQLHPSKVITSMEQLA